MEIHIISGEDSVRASLMFKSVVFYNIVMVVIAVSGQPGCGSSTTGVLLAKKLGLEFFSAGTYTKKMESASENMGKSQTAYAIDFWKTKRGKSREHHMAVEKLQQDLANKGNIVLEGKLAIRFVKNADFRVWLKAPADIRAKHYAKRDNISLEDAFSSLRNKEKLERENWKRIYGFDYFEQEKEADIVINTGGKAPEQIVKLIIDSMKAKK